MRFVACAVLLSLAMLGTARADSQGCGAAAGLQSVTVHSGGIDRDVAVYFPRAQRHGRRWPLIIDLHGSGSSGEAHAKTTGFRELADQRGLVIASPNGAVVLDAQKQAYAWNIPGVPLITGAMPPADTPDDLQFIADLIHTLIGTQCVDARRVYATGMSGGGRMTSLLGCRLSAQLAAIAPVAGLRAGLPSTRDATLPELDSCKPERALPVLSFHGTGDVTNPFLGGGAPYWGYSVERALERWAELDGCKSILHRRSISPFVTRLRYSGCKESAEVVLYVTDRPNGEGGGHVWPGSATAGNSLPASAIILKFFRKHALKVTRTE